jgi:phage terminase large subunit-like protein
MTYPWQPYIDEVLGKKSPAGRLEKLGVQHAMKCAEQYEHDVDEAMRVIEITRLFRHTKGKWMGKPFNLMPHQAFFLAYLFGMKDESGFRLYREAMLNMSKKGGKSELDGAIAVLMTFFDGEPKGEGYAVANKTEQAMFCWESAWKICTQMKAEYPDFDARFKCYHNQQKHILIDLESESTFKTLPYESSTLDGVMPHFAAMDEVHEYPDMKVRDNLRSGMVLREQPLLLYSTTRGFHPYGPLAKLEEYFEQVLKGEIEDWRVFPMIYAIDKPAEWTREKHWRQSNPGIAYGLPSAETLARERDAALAEGGEKVVAVKTKNFNLWQRASANYIDIAKWDAAPPLGKLEDYAGRECFAAFDIGRTDDLSAVGYLFPEPDGTFAFFLRAFMPEDMIDRRSREHKVVYRDWIADGWIAATPGNITDTTWVFEQISQDVSEFGMSGLKAIYADVAFAVELLNRLLDAGYPAEKFAQTYSMMNAPVLKLQALALQSKIRHGGNPVLSWMMSNVELKKNAGGQVMMDKSDRITGHGKDAKRGSKKIDGAVVLAMCIGGWMASLAGGEEASVYNERGIYVID